MEILKQGNIQKIRRVKRFACKHCGCVFTADNTEYRPADYYSNMHDGIDATCECPCCKSTAYSEAYCKPNNFT